MLKKRGHPGIDWWDCTAVVVAVLHDNVLSGTLILDHCHSLTSIYNHTCMHTRCSNVIILVKLG